MFLIITFAQIYVLRTYCLCAMNPSKIIKSWYVYRFFCTKRYAIKGKISYRAPAPYSRKSLPRSVSGSSLGLPLRAPRPLGPSRGGGTTRRCCGTTIGASLSSSIVISSGSGLDIIGAFGRMVNPLGPPIRMPDAPGGPPRPRNLSNASGSRLNKNEFMLCV